MGINENDLDNTQVEIKDVTETNDFEEKNTEEEIEDNGNPFLE